MKRPMATAVLTWLLFAGVFCGTSLGQQGPAPPGRVPGGTAVAPGKRAPQVQPGKRAPAGVQPGKRRRAPIGGKNEQTNFLSILDRFPVNIFGFFFVMIFLGVWLKTMDFVNNDAEQVGENLSLWNHLMLFIGLVSLGLMWYVHFAFLPVGLGVIFAVFAYYVVRRNQRVPSGYRIFTPEKIAEYINQKLGRLGIHIRTGKMSRRVASVSLILTKKDGTPLESAVRGNEGDISEVALATREMIETAIRWRATDIHMEPKGGEVQVRYRIDGVLQNVSPMPADLGRSVVASLKVLADMDIAERRKPQDGSFSGVMPGKELDFRVSTLPGVHGETMVIRILDRSTGLLRLDSLGMSDQLLASVRKVIHSPHGMMIVSGPTGAGKTTTLYAALMEIDAFQKNIITIEDPVEYRLDNVTQTGINVKAGVTFADTLRSILRQDPDIVMVGEIRDGETARIAMQAAMTGHFVFSTIHANDSVATLFRLLDLGVEPYLIASSLTSVLAQRLVRVLCPECKVPYKPTAEFLKKLKLDPKKVEVLYKAQGCEACQGTGYRGRVGIYEHLLMTPQMRDKLRENPSFEEMRKLARASGLVTMQEDGIRKVVQGITSVKEVIRVTKE